VLIVTLTKAIVVVVVVSNSFFPRRTATTRDLATKKECVGDDASHTNHYVMQGLISDACTGQSQYQKAITHPHDWPGVSDQTHTGIHGITFGNQFVSEYGMGFIESIVVWFVYECAPLCLQGTQEGSKGQCLVQIHKPIVVVVVVAVAALGGSGSYLPVPDIVHSSFIIIVVR